MRKRVRNILPLVALIVVGIVICAEARVFMRWGKARHINRLITNRGGKKAYEAEMNINGEPSSISVFGMPRAAARNKGKMIAASVNNGNTVTKLLGIQLSTRPIVFKIDMPVNTTTPRHHYLKAIPPYPESTPAFFSRNEDTEMSLSISRSTSSPGRIRSFYDSTMTTAGWKTPFPSLGKNHSGMSVYLKANEVACVSVDIDKKSGDTRITLLHKKHGIK